MCTTCGCSESTGARLTDPNTEEGLVGTPTANPGADIRHRPPPEHSHARLHDHDHGHAHDHDHSHDHGRAHDHDHNHDLGCAHDHGRAHDHTHDHEHTHDHTHAHDHAHAHDHDHDHSYGNDHGHAPGQTHQQVTTVTLEERILARNQLAAERNRGWLAGRQIVALNLMSSPGSGKTTILERTIRDLSGKTRISVIEGDQATTNDAERIRATGCKAIQINTGTGCHLDAEMLARGLDALQPSIDSVVMIENVGNLVCPALFDLGERAKVVILSVTEGEDKPIKYPHMFRVADVVVLNKIDLLPYLQFDVQRCLDHARRVNPRARVFQVSAVTGEGMDAWCAWLKSLLPARSMPAGAER